MKIIRMHGYHGKNILKSTGIDPVNSNRKSLVKICPEDVPIDLISIT